MPYKCSHCGHVFSDTIIERIRLEVSLGRRTPPHASPRTHRRCPGGTLQRVSNVTNECGDTKTLVAGT